MDEREEHQYPELPPQRSILELETVPLDPVLSGFVGAVIELSEHEDTYTLFEFSAGTGNEILKVTSSDEDFIRALFDHELKEFNRFANLYALPDPPTRESYPPTDEIPYNE
jgi:hypothetical protein